MRKIMNFRPTLCSAAAVISAIISAYLIFVASRVEAGIALAAGSFLIFVVAPLIICAIFKKDKLKISLIFSFLVIIFSCVAFLRFYATVYNYSEADLGDVYITVCGRVDKAENFDGGKEIIVSDAEFSGRLKGNNGYKIRVIVYGKNDLDTGDKISFSAVVRDNGIMYENKFRATDVSSGIKYSAYVDYSEISVEGNAKTVFESVNVGIREALKAGLDKDAFTVAYALICGNSDYSESEILDSYRNAGVAHIFAVSGLHIGFLAAILGFILKKTKINPYVAAAITCGILLFYSGVCGFSASSLRAAVMCGVALCVSASGGRYDGLSSLSIAAIIITLFSPVQVFCAGFVLSFSVVFGIIVAARPIGRIFRFLPVKIADTVGAVFAAWMFSVPISLIYFGEVSLFAVVSNMIFIPIVGVIYVFLMVSLIFSFISPTVFLFLPNAVLSAVNYAINIIDYEPFVIGGITLTATAVFYYISIIFSSGILNFGKTVKICVSSAFAAVFCFCTVMYNLAEASDIKAYAVGSYGLCATVAEGESQRVVIISYAERGFPVNRIKRVLDKSEKITDLFILSDIDVNNVLTRFSAICGVRRAYFYAGNGSAATYGNSFKSVEFCEIGEEATDFCDFEIAYGQNGLTAKISAKGKSVLVFAEIKERSFDFSEAAENKNYALIIAYDYLERIAAVCPHERFLSYRNSEIYDDAERSGNFLFKFA